MNPPQVKKKKGIFNSNTCAYIKHIKLVSSIPKKRQKMTVCQIVSFLWH